MDYKKQANDFCDKYSVKIDIVKSTNQSAPLWCDDGRHGYKYDITIIRNNISKTFPFWDSIHNKELEATINNAKPLQWFGGGVLNGVWRDSSYIRKFLKDNTITTPTNYEILACLTKYEPGSFKNFCDNFGYSDNSIKARQTWEAVTNEWYEIVQPLFGDCLDELQEIN
jgi:hypothetical protein